MVFTFEGLVPIPRYDNKSFTEVEVFEGPTSLGPWTSLGTQALTPDPDPTNPEIRNITVENATEVDGWYYVVFSDVDGDMMLPSTPMKRTTPPENVGYLPTVNDVADLIRARTKDRFGNEIGTFNNNTRPTGHQVIGLIQKAASDVLAPIDYDVPAESWQAVQDLIALGAAMRVELSYFPEQVGTDRTAYEEFERMYNRMLESLTLAVERERAEEIGGENMPSSIAFGFPTAEPLWSKRF